MQTFVTNFKISRCVPIYDFSFIPWSKGLLFYDVSMLFGQTFPVSYQWLSLGALGAVWQDLGEDKKKQKKNREMERLSG